MGTVAHPVIPAASSANSSLLAADQSRPPRTREHIEAWFRAIDELDAGEVIPGGRDQEALTDLDGFPALLAKVDAPL